MRPWMAAVLGGLLACPGAAYGYEVFFGNLHAHTALSDGIGTPEEAFAYARDVADIDILALTEHTHMLTQTEWTRLQGAADAFTEDDVFVALAAQEFGNLNDFGHMSIYDCAYRNPNPTENLLATYQFLRTQGAFANFNHPNPTYGTNFDDLAFYSEYVDVMVGLEVRNGIRADDYHEQYVQALRNGWKVGPLANQDNHEGRWGDQPNPNMGGQIYLTGFLADRLTREEILDAYRARRFFAAEVDPISDRIALEFYADGQIMGSDVVSGAHLTLTGTARSLNGVSLFNQAELFEDGERVAVHQAIGTEIAWQFDRALAEGESHFYFVRIRQVDGDLAWSAPVWVTAQVDPASAESPAEGGTFFLLPGVPNPARERTALAFHLPSTRDGEPWRVGLRITDVAGRQVWAAPVEALDPGRHERVWGGSDPAGRRLPAGLYFVCLDVNGATRHVRRVVLVQ